MSKISEVKWYKTIRMKLIMVIVFTITLVLGSVGIYSYHLIKKTEQENLQVLADVTASRLSFHLKNPMWGVDNQHVDELLITEMAEQKIVAIVVTDEDGKTPFSAKKRDLDGKVIDFSGEISGNYIEVKRTVTYADDIIGRVAVYITPQYMVLELQRFGQGVLIALLIINCVIVLIMSVFLGKILIKPLLELAVVAEKISKGDLKERVSARSSDEIGYLVTTFGRMQDSLSIAVRRLRQSR